MKKTAGIFVFSPPALTQPKLSQAPCRGLE